MRLFRCVLMLLTLVTSLVNSMLADRCALAHEGHQPLPSKGVQVDLEKGLITLSPQAREAIDLETSEILLGKVQSELKVYAEAIASWDAKAFGSAQISGRIMRLLAHPGELVAKGQVIAELSSRELDALRAEVELVRSEKALNEELLEMTRPTASSGAVPEQRLLELENSWQQSERRLAMLQLRAQALGIIKEQIDQPHAIPLQHLIRAPIAGRIIHSDLSEGKYVEAFEHLFEIVDPKQTWVRLQILEKDLFRIEVGQQVGLQFSATSGLVSGVIDRIDAGLDPITQVAWAWVTLTDSTIVPGMVGTATITTDSQHSKLAVPLQAVHSDGLQPYVFVEESSTSLSAEYRKCPITLGQRRLHHKSNRETTLEVLQGDLYPGDRVVIQGGHQLSSLFFLGALKVSAEDRQRLGIEATAATHRSIISTTALPATVTLPPQHRSVAAASVAGTIMSHRLTPGMEVERGDLLFEIASPEFYQLQLDLLSGVLDAEWVRSRVDRFEDGRSDAISRRLFLETVAQAQQLNAKVTGIQQQLIAIGLTEQEVNDLARDKQILERLPIRAAIRGRVVSWQGTLGETVAANQPLVEIHDLRLPWIEAYVPSEAIPHVALGRSGLASVLARPETQFRVQVSRLGPVVSDATRTQRIWLVPSIPTTGDSRDQLNDFVLAHPLRAGMLMTVILETGEATSCLSVPLTAVLRDGLNSFVFILESNDYVQRRRVTTGRSDGEYVEILTGVRAGEMVIGAGGRELQTAYAAIR